MTAGVIQVYVPTYALWYPLVWLVSVIPLSYKCHETIISIFTYIIISVALM